MDRIARPGHIIAGGFYTRGGVRAGNNKFIDTAIADEGAELLGAQRAALGLGKDVAGYDLQLRDKLRAARTGLEGPRPGGEVIVPDIDDRHAFAGGQINGLVDALDDIPVVFGDVVLKVYNDQSFAVHMLLLSAIRSSAAISPD